MSSSILLQSPSEVQILKLAKNVGNHVGVGRSKSVEALGISLRKNGEIFSAVSAYARDQAGRYWAEHGRAARKNVGQELNPIQMEVVNVG